MADRLDQTDELILAELADNARATFAEIGGFRIDPTAAHALGDRGATRAELRPFVEGGEADDGKRAERNDREEPRLPQRDGGPGRGLVNLVAAMTGVSL